MALPTESEMVISARWFERLLASRTLPVAARYGERSLSELLPGWPVQESTRQLDDRRTEHTLEFSDPGTGLVLRWEGIVYKDFPAVEWVTYLENTGNADTPILADIQALDTLFPVAEDQRCWVHHHRGSKFRLEDFEPFETPLILNGVAPDLELATVGGRSSDGASPFMNLQTGQSGIILAVGWTGGWAAGFHRDPQGVHVVAGMQKTHLKLYPGEKIRTPRHPSVVLEGDRWHGQNLLRSFILTHHTPRRNGEIAEVPVTEGSWGELPVDTHLAQIRYIQEHRIPATAYWLDAGWYGDAPYDPQGTVWSRTWAKQVGNWYPNPNLYPQGLKPIGDALRVAGLDFILWFEPERVVDGTEITREHPEFLTGKVYSKYIDRDIYLFNLGDPAARRWMTSRISGLIEEFGVTIYRQDFNTSPGPIWANADTPDRIGMSEIRHIEGLYAFWDELLACHPGLIIDNCSSGGRRIDLESISRGITLTRSDVNDWPYNDDNIMAMQTLTMGLSPWYPMHLTADREANIYTVRSVFGAGIGMGWSYTAATTGQHLVDDALLTRLHEALAARPYFYGDFYSLLPFSLSRGAWAAWQCDRPDLGAGIVQAFRREESPIEAARFQLHGLHHEAQYEVTDADSGTRTLVTGRELMEQGLPVRINERRATALLHYRVLG